MILILPCAGEIPSCSLTMFAQYRKKSIFSYGIIWSRNGGGWVGFEDLKEKGITGVLPWSSPSKCVPFSMQKRSLSTCYQIHGWHCAGIGICLREISPNWPNSCTHYKNDRSNIFVLVSLFIHLIWSGLSKTDISSNSKVCFSTRFIGGWHLKHRRCRNKCICQSHLVM